MDLFWLSMAAAAGGCIALQASANGSLRGNLGSPYFAAFFSICGTILTATAFMLLTRPQPPSLAAVRSAPWWNWIGGPLGALIVLAGAAVIPKVGAAAFIAAVVGGQLALSLVLDHFGWMDLQAQPITPGRLLGAVMVFVGVLLVRHL
jgi:transporter family-2 protein